MICRKKPPKRGKLSRRPKSPAKRLKAACDKVFSLIVRQRDGWTCQRCGVRDGYGSTNPRTRIDNAHIVSRKYDQTRHCESNCVALCRHCHAYFSLHDRDQTEWRMWVTGKYGEVLLGDLDCRKHIHQRIDWGLLLIALKARAKELEIPEEWL